MDLGEGLEQRLAPPFYFNHQEQIRDVYNICWQHDVLVEARVTDSDASHWHGPGWKHHITNKLVDRAGALSM